MIILIKLIIAHFIGDFLLQPKSWVEDKENRKAKSVKLYLHILIHGLLVLLILWDLNYWLLALLLMLSHGIIDILKLYAQKEGNKSKWFLIDQVLHVISILGLWVLFVKPEINFASWYENTNFWVYSVALLFITIVSGIGMREIMSNWSKALNDEEDESLKNAGKYIGILERLFVFIFVVTGNWEAIGFLLAAKSVFRFGDLKESKDRKLTEYILIGTLLSFGIAIATGMVVLKLIEK
ncbi:DUF3307 domain-containing protein [Aequorivita viscosa]|jgi:hypothetical protein|uniref:DUF3307 domain-containing protein n=1 Tax=Aequorivita viscosa TaxID=797419 RepID=A0A1M6MFX8_9FLAO|nr:DUF3307 domain-containing protein [Aequorivita viscosa]SDX33315.1 Protein of unknown function [Aequorivita viscosa]SHJ82337.1 Protein of unknown function [Aequorivita viscosa]